MVSLDRPEEVTVTAAPVRKRMLPALRWRVDTRRTLPGRIGW